MRYRLGQFLFDLLGFTGDDPSAEEGYQPRDDISCGIDTPWLGRPSPPIYSSRGARSSNVLTAPRRNWSNCYRGSGDPPPCEPVINITRELPGQVVIPPSLLLMLPAQAKNGSTAQVERLPIAHSEAAFSSETHNDQRRLPAETDQAGRRRSRSRGAQLPAPGQVRDAEQRAWGGPGAQRGAARGPAPSWAGFNRGEIAALAGQVPNTFMTVALEYK